MHSLTVTIHISLATEPLLAGTAVLDVLQDLREHRALQALLISCLLEVVICPGTYGKQKPRLTSCLGQDLQAVVVLQ